MTFNIRITCCHLFKFIFISTLANDSGWFINMENSESTSCNEVSADDFILGTELSNLQTWIALEATQMRTDPVQFIIKGSMVTIVMPENYSSYTILHDIYLANGKLVSNVTWRYFKFCAKITVIGLQFGVQYGGVVTARCCQRQDCANDLHSLWCQRFYHPESLESLTT